jgi:hypothetical protein
MANALELVRVALDQIRRIVAINLGVGDREPEAMRVEGMKVDA